jgi:putative N6-adenine-specific DNA methylase
VKASLFLPCAGGVEALLVDEVKRLGGKYAKAGRGGVEIDGDTRLAMKLNLESRLAQRVLWPLAHGAYRHEQDLYDLARDAVRWADWITPRQTLRVDTTAQRAPLQSLNFASLRIKDAVCDTLRDATGERPSVDPRAPDLPLALHLTATHATLYVDLSGEPLFKRGWRGAGAQKGEAPLKETLAAAMLAAAGWQGRAESGPLLDPACGAGTIVIEAAQLACGVAPGAARRFAFEKLAPFRDDLAAWRTMQREARERVHAPAVPLFAGDVSFRMTDFAARNAERAGVAGAIEFKTADALQRPPPAPAGTMIMNPPYGERIAPKGALRGERIDPKDTARSREAFGDGASAADFYAGLAAHWKRAYAGWTAWVLSPDPKLPSMLRLKESRRVPLWNGAIECRLLRFDISAGSYEARKP